MNRIFAIFNPAARGEKARRLQRFLQARAAASPALTVLPTAAAGEAQQLAAQAVASGAQLVIAAGGDGTINEVVNGLGNSGVPLGILPLGTVNVFARELGLPRTLQAAWRVIEAGHTRAVDLGMAESPGSGRRYFAQLAGVGLDAWAVQHASWQLKKRVGPLSYVWAGLKAVAQPCAPIGVESGSAGVPLTSATVVLIGNGRYYGGPFPVFPGARLDDGLLDVCIFHNGRYRDVLRYAWAVCRSRHVRLPDVQYFQARQFTCSAAPAAPYELDGELVGQTPVRFTVQPAALRVIVPQAGKAAAEHAATGTG